MQWEAWQKQLTVIGVMVGNCRLPVCPYHQNNLIDGGQLALNSISDKLYEDVMATLETQPSSLEALAEIIQIKQQLDAAGIRALEDELRGMDLAQQPAENVIEFNKKLKNVAIKLEGCNKTPDLAVLAAE